MTSDHEQLEIVDIAGNVIGLARRVDLHANPSLLHMVVHVLVFNQGGDLLLQKRSLGKDVAPGKWDTSVGGHVLPGEDIVRAAEREMEEELGISGCPLHYLYKYIFSNDRESELVTTFTCVWDGEVNFNREEIDEVRFWKTKELSRNIGRNIFSGHFEKEISNYLDRQSKT